MLTTKLFQFKGIELTINCYDTVRQEKHKGNKQHPDHQFSNPSTVMPGVTLIILILDTNHYKCKQSKKQEIPQTDTKNSLCLKPFLRVIVWSVYPYNQQNIWTT